MAFVENVLDELIAVFPGSFVHLGGDEAVKDQWQRSPRVQAQMKTLGLKDENALQSWMIDTFGRYLASKGRRLIGWDEILEGGLPPSASVMSWRGEKGAVDAANQGHDVVLTPAPTLYFDSLQSDQADEPPGRLSIQTLADVYAYEPMPAGIDAAKAKHVLGAQGNAWSEYLVTPYQVQHAIFPRAAALAETTWSTAPRDFPGFVARLRPQVLRWRQGGIEVADSAFAVTYRLQGTRGDALRSGKLNVALATQAPAGTIRYTLDGSAPTAPIARLCRAAGASIRRDDPRGGVRRGRRRDRRRAGVRDRPCGAAPSFGVRSGGVPARRARPARTVDVGGAGQCAGIQHQPVRHVQRLSRRAARRGEGLYGASRAARAALRAGARSLGSARALQR